MSPVYRICDLINFEGKYLTMNNAHKEIRDKNKVAPFSGPMYSTRQLSRAVTVFAPPPPPPNFTHPIAFNADKLNILSFGRKIWVGDEQYIFFVYLSIVFLLESKQLYGAQIELKTANYHNKRQGVMSLL